MSLQRIGLYALSAVILTPFLAAAETSGKSELPVVKPQLQAKEARSSESVNSVTGVKTVSAGSRTAAPESKPVPPPEQENVKDASSIPVVRMAEKPTYTLKFNHVVDPNTPKGMAAEFFKKRAEELTAGKVKVIVWPNGTLFTDKDELLALQANVIQIAAPSFANFMKGSFGNFQLFDLPYAFKDLDDVHKITDGPTGKAIFDALEIKNFKGLAYWDNGLKQFSMTTPMDSISDFNGKRIRIQESEILNNQMKKLGAVPVPLSFAKVVENLQKGTIDGAENPISNFYSKKMYEYQPYLALTNHGYLGYAVVANLQFWNSLPKEIQSQLEQAMKETTVYENKLAIEKNQTDLEALRRLGKTKIVEPTPELKATLREALLPVQEDSVHLIGRSVLKKLHEETGYKN